MGIGTRLFVWDPDTLSEVRMTQPVISTDTLNVSSSATNLTTRVVTADGYTYIGKAAVGTSESALTWQIARIDTNGNKLFADGVASFNKQWASYATYSYS